ncbi:MAG: GGDEF domain-containing protein [Gammaproteobacteria bacterium]|nr:GGDEF domain-containing protein [Gammaproteobacteria bacterium]
MSYGPRMVSGEHTTVIRRVLERRSQPPHGQPPDTATTMAVMLRVLPPPRLLLAVLDAGARRRLEHGLVGVDVTLTTADDETVARRQLEAEPCHIVITDSRALARHACEPRAGHRPVVLFALGFDDANERQAAHNAGAVDCFGPRISEDELHVRVGLARRIAELETVLRTTLAENRRLATLDELTGVTSRRFFAKNFPREVERAARYGRPLAVALCDIDHFKKVNDTLGHAAGDEVLRQFGERVQRELRHGIDWVARLGGEEFAIVLPETTREQALVAVRKLRVAVADVPFIAAAQRLPVTASFGLCGADRVPVGQKHVPNQMLKAADAALYRSKHDGRNRITATVLPASGS